MKKRWRELEMVEEEVESGFCLLSLTNQPTNLACLPPSISVSDRGTEARREERGHSIQGGQ